MERQTLLFVDDSLASLEKKLFELKHVNQLVLLASWHLKGKVNHETRKIESGAGKGS